MDPKRTSIQKYFSSKFPKWALVLIAIGILVVLGGGSSSGGAVLFGILLAAAGAYGIYNYTQIPTDQQIDQWIREDLQRLDERALNKAGIDKSEIVSEPVTILGVGDFSIWKLGKDKIVRFGKIAGTVINFTQNQLLSYSCTVDITTGNTVKERTDEYFYKDVVSASTKTKDGQIGGIHVVAGEYFTLTTSGGTSIEVFLRSPDIGKKFGGEMPATDAERAIQTVRKMLREKKA